MLPEGKWIELEMPNELCQSQETFEWFFIPFLLGKEGEGDRRGSWKVNAKEQEIRRWDP